MNRRQMSLWTQAALSASAAPGCSRLPPSAGRKAPASRPAPTAGGPPNVSVLPYPDPVFKGVIGRTTEDSKSDFPQPVKAPKGAPNVLLDPDRRRRLRRVERLRRPGSDADLRGARRERPQIQRVQYDRPLLADARGADHRARSAHGAYRHHHGAQPRLPRLRFADAEELRHRRRNSARERLQHRLVRQESQRARPGRAAPSGRSTCGRPGSASTISTGSSAATPTSGIRPCSRTRLRSNPRRS